MDRYIDRSACKETTCMCHDDKSWELRANGEPRTYRSGCTGCGCRWGRKAPAQNKTRRETVAAILAGKTPVKLAGVKAYLYTKGQPGELWSLPLNLSDESRQARLDAAANNSEGRMCFTGAQDNYEAHPLHVKPISQMSYAERDKYLSGQVKRWSGKHSGHEGLRADEREEVLELEAVAA